MRLLWRTWELPRRVRAQRMSELLTSTELLEVHVSRQSRLRRVSTPWFQASKIQRP
jgi:hypothetical protein